MQVLGVDPLYHGKELGSALMQHALVVGDIDENLIYLESSNPKSMDPHFRTVIGFTPDRPLIDILISYKS